MKNTDIEMLEKYKKRVKSQNEAAKENWDIVSCRLPKGTKKRIKALGLSVNGVINKSVLSFLECMEEEHKEELERLETPTERKETHQIELLEEQEEQTTQEEQNTEEIANNDSKTNRMTLADVQALIDKKKAKKKEQEEALEKVRQERKEREKAERKKVINEAIDSICNQEEEQ